ncbi:MULTISPECIES: AIM24 family protein [unclassified Streptomyces]|uniref:AIM24 family protein n=1 Tax=unclassified Streptomyces TaxID=2593676 RepID=UPI00224E888B|nr:MULTISPECIES: AIM24 family protein [unclassified Streptomyces]WSP58317.1 AIM24 family protein [Streptomyces sp. NBC_01241]WSU21108.1 AIM24 family protein [Streptomyces sp. NBC_01108]MCX4790068.1 AIM24 family protein [Streptomyces sp. NBC_01221]MCX4794206.1 AIM24 family protein [Streptomyces sp. NBC_01242]WSJ35600.1 AIM24 family protein [Streptomyces sp. NBC_01321]
MKSDLFSSENMAQQATAPGMTLQNAKSIKYAVNGEMHARQGSMIAFRGDLQFERKGQGLGGMLKRAVTGEGLALMAVRGQGEAWFAHEAANCFIVEMEQGDVLTINGRNVLCFDPTLSYEIKTVKGAGMTGGGLFNSVFTGYGKLGLMCEGHPIVIPVTPHQPVCVDTDAVVGWSANLNTSLHRSQSFGSMIRGGSGEAVQLRLDGEGFVIVRPSELKPEKASAN